VKEVVLPFSRFPGVDVILGPEMKSTGEVMGIDVDFDSAFAKAQLASGMDLPTEGTVFISIKDTDKTEKIVKVAKMLKETGFDIIATKGTVRFLKTHGIISEPINKVLEGSPHIVDKMNAGEISLVINTTEGEKSISDSFSIRQTALSEKIAYATTANGARELAKAIKRVNSEFGLEVRPLQSYSS
jgi:carbamoyl-phosphate synthase large subunit